MNKMKVLVIIMTLFLVVSCQSITRIDVPEKGEIVLPDRIKLNVVHIPQLDDYSCATTSVAMAISYLQGNKEKPLDKNTVWKLSGTSISTVKCCGNDMDGLSRIADHYGYKSEFSEGLSFFEIEYLLYKNIPVTINVLQQVGGNATHAVLVVGYDRVERVFFINDPAELVVGNRIGYDDLASRWSAYVSSPGKMTHRSALIIYPKTILP